MKKLTIILLFGLTIVWGCVEAKSGCCSWHGGVRSNGCGCNDGTSLSVSCAPYYSCTPNKTILNNNSSYGYHSINYQGECYSNEWYFSDYDKNVRKYLSSAEYTNEKEYWRERLKAKDGDFLKSIKKYVKGKEIIGIDYESFLSDYTYNISTATTNLDDTDCFKPFAKLSEYINSYISSYNTEQNSFKNKVKKYFNWFK